MRWTEEATPHGQTHCEGDPLWVEGWSWGREDWDRTWEPGAVRIGDGGLVEDLLKLLILGMA